MIFVGIDNGLSGGIVVLNKVQHIVAKWPMPVIKGKKTEYNIGAICKIFEEINHEANAFVVLEKAHVRPVSGKRASFLTGFGYGVMQAILESHGYSYEIVSPKDWQSDVLKGMNTGDSKKDSIMFCKRKWPEVDWTPTDRSTKPSDGMTDAACMALYALRRNLL